MSKLSPHQAASALQEALALHGRGQLAAAEKIYARILKSFPDQFDALHLSGLARLQSGKAGEALRLITAALKVAPRSADAHANLGLALGALKRPADALASFDHALALAPDHLEAQVNRGNVLLDLGRNDEALACFDRVLVREPRHLPARVNRGNALMALGRAEEAIGDYDAALALGPADAKALFNRANALFRLGRTTESLAGFDRLLALAPQHAEGAMTRGLALQALGRHPEALASYNQAIALRKDYADAHVNAALARLTLGDTGGFAEYEWRWKRAGIARASYDKPLWLGEYPLGRKTILLHAEQGLGDTIQFVRYAPLLARAGAKVVLEVQGELKALLGAVAGVTAVVARGEALPAFDVHCPLGSLPLALKTELGRVPAEIPYLRASEERVERWRPGLEALAGKRVGLAWAGNPSHINDRNRSIALARLAPLLSTPCVSCIGLQRDVRDADRDIHLKGPNFVNFGPEFVDFSDSSAVISHCDLVLSVDTAVAHLAAAMGRPTWILLPYWPDWRWGLSGETSPWYPQARLFRQTVDGDWDSVIAQVKAEIAVKLGS